MFQPKRHIPLAPGSVVPLGQVGLHWPLASGRVPYVQHVAPEVHCGGGGDGPGTGGSGGSGPTVGGSSGGGARPGGSSNDSRPGGGSAACCSQGCQISTSPTWPAFSGSASWPS